MTMPPEEITVTCPKCGETYKDWYRPSMNLMLDDFDDDYIEEMSSVTCPSCETKVRMGSLVVGEDGTFWVPGMTEVGALLGAARFAAERHSDQRRKDIKSSPYINHVLSVAEVLTHHGIEDIITLQAALLHDTIEDTETSPDELDDLFGSEVLSVVLEVTDDKSLDKVERKRIQIEKSPHLSDRAKLVKLGDMISNVTDVGANPPADWSQERRIEYLDWTEQVVNGCRGVHEWLEEHYDMALDDAREALGVSEH